MARLTASRLAVISLLVTLLMAGWIAKTIAQSTGTALSITEVESQAFPRVGVQVAVADAQGPVEGLTAENFQITEEGTPVPAEAIEVKPDRVSNLRVVLGLDVSGSPADLAEAQQAAKAFIDTLDPQDRLAVMSFGDDVRLVRDFTNNTDELHTAIDSLAAIGSLTVLNKTLIEAVNSAAQAQTGRKAVILITNRLDNSKPPVPIGDSLSQAQASNTPIYVIGFGRDVPATSPLQSQLATVGGQYITVPNARSIQKSLSDLGELLRQGYRATFTSSLKADNADHPFVMTVTRPDGQSAQAESQFKATAGPIKVEVSGLTPGQEVSGTVNLAPQVTAPAPLASVEYLLDGQSLALVSEQPYTLEWSSATTAPGVHTLTLQATDSAGNTGQTALDFTVVVPLHLSLSSPKTEVEVGDVVPLQANILASNQLARVDFLLDDVVLESKTEPPFQFDLESSHYTPGAHVITLRVEDSAGYVGEDSLTLQFLPKPLPQLSWYERLTRNPRARLAAILAATILTLLAILLLTLLLLRLIRRSQYRRSQRLCHLEILNNGNIASRYQLQARDTLGALNFQFALNGAKLPFYTPLPPRVAVAAASRTATGPLTPVSSPASPAGGSSGSTGPTVSARAGQALDKAGATQSQAYGCIYSLVDVLTAVSSLLPGPMGAPLRSISSWLSSGQASVDRAVRTPTEMARTADYVRGQVAGAVPTRGEQVPQVSRPDTGRFEPVQTVPVSQEMRTTPMEAQRYQPGQSSGYPRSTEIWAQTPAIDPEGTLLVDVLIIPANPYQRRSYPFTMHSKSLEQEQAPLVSEQGVLDFPGISWFWRYVPVMIVLLFAILLLFGVTWLAAWRLNEMKLLEALTFIQR